MQSRVRLFRVPVTIPQGQQVAVEPCKQHMALWIVSGAQAHDAKQVVGLQALPHTCAPGTVVGLNELLVTPCVPEELAQYSDSRFLISAPSTCVSLRQQIGQGCCPGGSCAR